MTVAVKVSCFFVVVFVVGGGGGRGSKYIGDEIIQVLQSELLDVYTRVESAVMNDHPSFKTTFFVDSFPHHFFLSALGIDDLVQPVDWMLKSRNYLTN